MKSKKIISSAMKNFSKYYSILLLLSLTSVVSCATFQYGFDAQENSRFSTFDNLGIAKEDFLKQYGPPTNKSLYQETPAEKVEKLYYIERIKDFLVTTEFIFKNDVLKQMERIETRYQFPEIRDQREIRK